MLRFSAVLWLLLLCGCDVEPPSAQPPVVGKPMVLVARVERLPAKTLGQEQVIVSRPKAAAERPPTKEELLNALQRLQKVMNGIEAFDLGRR